MGLRFNGHNNMWMDLIGRASPFTVIITYLILSLIFSSIFMYGLAKIDIVLEKTFTTVLNIQTNQFLQHILSYCGNFLICVLFFDLAVVCFQTKNKTKLNLDKIMFNFALTLFFICAIFSTISIFVPTSWLTINIFFTLVLSVFISWIVNKFSKFSDAIDLKINLATLSKINENVRKNGFTTFVFDPFSEAHNNIMLSCSPEMYEYFHELIVAYSKDIPSSKMLMTFIKDKKIKVDNNYNFVDSNNQILSPKDFLKHYHEYVTDFKRLNTTKPNSEFLGV